VLLGHPLAAGILRLNQASPATSFVSGLNCQNRRFSPSAAGRYGLLCRSLSKAWNPLKEKCDGCGTLLRAACSFTARKSAWSD